MNTDFPLKAQDAIIGDVIIYPEMDMSRTLAAQNTPVTFPGGRRFLCLLARSFHSNIPERKERRLII